MQTAVGCQSWAMTSSNALTVILFLLGTLRVSSVGSASTPKGRPQFVQVSPRVGFTLNQDLLDWHGAFKACKSRNATMAFPDTPREGDMLLGFVVNSVNNTSTVIHLGFHSMFSAENYTALEGYDTDTYGYLQWDPQSENGTDQRCGAFSSEGLKTIECSTLKESVCESNSAQPFDKIEGFGFYSFLDFNMNWEGAIGMCKMEASHLLILRSASEYDAIFNFYTETGDINGTVEIYYGAHQVFADGWYLTIADEQIEDSGYNVWAPGEPGEVTSDDFPLVGLRLTDPNTPDSQAGLFALESGTRKSFICKRDLH